MKKLTLLGVVFILIAATVVPVMAAGPGHGHGNGNGNGVGNGNNQGQGNSTGVQDQTQQQNQDQYHIRNRDQISNHGLGGNGNQFHMRMRTPFYLQGIIAEVDTISQTVTVTPYHGNAQIKMYLGQDLELQASDTTLIFQITQGEDGEGEGTLGSASLAPTTSNENVSVNDDGSPPNRIPIPFEQLAKDQIVAIHGNVVDGVYYATLITVYIKTPIGQPVIEKP